jgi:hypothetical protein
MSEVAQLEDGKRRELKELALRGAMDEAMLGAPAPELAASAPAQPKDIVKQGLSEYFIYTIEGTETIPNGWSKRMRSLEPAAVPLDIEYRYRLPEYGDRLVRMYLMRNDKESSLGTTPLPDGMVRVFRRTGHGTLSFLVAQSIQYIPIGDKIELNLGVDPEVIFELVKLDVWRDAIWMQVHGADVFRRVDDGAIKIEPNSSVAGWDEHTLYAQRTRNYTDKPIKLEVRRTLPGHIVFRSKLDAILHDYQTVEYHATVDVGAERDLLYEVIQSQGHNQKQDNVTIDKAEPKRP